MLGLFSKQKAALPASMASATVKSKNILACEFNAILPIGMAVSGGMTLDNGVTLIVEGNVWGSITKQNISLTGKVVVILKPTATVTGDIVADTVILDGVSFSASLKANEVIMINGASVVGNVTYSNLAIETGCKIDGSLAHMNWPLEAPAIPDVTLSNAILEDKGIEP
jgi:cytoskeletal protein CcmA (bactofilin family)